MDCCSPPRLNTFTIGDNTYTATKYEPPYYWNVGKDSIGVFLGFPDLHPAIGNHKIGSFNDTTRPYKAFVGIVNHVNGKRQLYYSTGLDNKELVVDSFDNAMYVTIPAVWVKSDLGDSTRVKASLKVGL
jgi:hypothetical protein